MGDRVGPLHDNEKKQIIAIYLLISDLKLPIYTAKKGFLIGL